MKKHIFEKELSEMQETELEEWKYVRRNDEKRQIEIILDCGTYLLVHYTQ